MDTAAKDSEDSTLPQAPKCKVVFLGSSGVGKTSIVCRFIRNEFDKDYSPTVGIDFFTKPLQVLGQTVNLQIWDTAGQERFASLIPSYIRESSIAVITYDVSVPASFEEAKEWHTKAQEERGRDVRCIFVGNKTDLERRVNAEDVTTFAQQHGIQEIETCAKTGQNVQRLFKMISESVPDPTQASQEPPPVTVVEDPASHQSGCFC
jgi:small GTP-binding protein